jgi:hypothetical protein
MSDELFHDIEAYLQHEQEGGAGLEYLRSLGEDGLDRLVQQIETDYRHAVESVELSGRDHVRIAVLAQTLAGAAGITSRDGKDTMARLVEVGWMMARWYGRE